MRRRAASWSAVALVVLAAGCGRDGSPGGAPSGKGSSAGRSRLARLPIDDVLTKLSRRSTRLAAIRELARRKDKKALTPLMGHVEDKDPAIRAAAIAALGEIGDKRAVPYVRTKLSDRAAAVRVAAAEALGNMPDPAAALWLAEQLKEDYDPKVRLATVRSLARVPVPLAMRTAARALDDRDAAVADAAGEGLGRAGPPAVNAIEEVLPRLGAAARLRAARALAKIRLPETLPAAILALELSAADAGRDARETCRVLRDALVAIGEPAVGPLAAAAVHTSGKLPLKRQAADVMKRIGRPFAAHVARRINTWQTFPDGDELRIWVGVLEAIGGDEPAAKAALAKARAQLAGRPAPAAATRPAHVASTAPSTVPAGEAAPVGAPSGGFAGELRLVLQKALFQGRTPADRPQHLVLHLSAEVGRWRRVWGMALGYNNGLHRGRVREGTVGADAARLKLDVLTGSDLWVPGGDAGAYAVELKRSGDAVLTGTFTGRFKGRPVAGEARGEVKPPRPVRVAGFRPVRPGEHPRVLLRRGDLPALRAKLKTPFGQAYRRRAVTSWDLVSLGMLHQLTGERQYADEARKVVQGYRGDIAKDGFGSGGFGHRLARVALAYDLCCGAWPAAFKGQIEQGLVTFIRSHQRHLMTSHPNFHPCSNYYGPGRAVPAIASLVLWGRPGPPPAEPADPVEQAQGIDPPADYAPGKGVPVVDFAPGRVPATWLWAGPLAFKTDRDLLAGMGGCAKARPEAGATARYVTLADGLPRESTLTFRPLPAGIAGAGGIDLARLAAGQKAATTILFTALTVAREQVVALVRGRGEPQVFLAGRELNERAYYRLRPGTYPLLVVHSTTRPAGTIAPRLAAPDSDDLADRRAACELARAMWRMDQADHRRLGGADPEVLRFVEIGGQQVRWHYRLGIGDGGFQAETGGYADIASWYPLVYATAHRTFFGRDASPYADVTHLMPRRLMQVLFRTDGTSTVEKINSAVGVKARWCAAAFPIVPESYKPAVLWAWNRVTGVTGPAARASALAEGDGLTLAHTFLHYPLDMQPVHPGKVMPLSWQAPTFGYHCFRSGWSADDDFIAQVFLKARPVGGWNHPNAGTFRVLGLGRAWTAGSTSRNGVREQEPVVLLPDDEINEGACGRLAHLRTWPDGSASLTIDLDDVYSAATSRLYDRNLIRWPQRLRASGITGLRAMAFDYSRTSGAAAMMVLVDRIRGGKRKLWTWPVPKEGAGKVRLDPAGRGFTLEAGDASMKATFVVPREVELSVGTDAVKVGDARHGFHGNVDRVKATARPGAAGAAGEGFFVVATFQRGAAPEVKVEGAGFGAKVTVGRQAVRFDGGKIILGEP